MQWWKHAKPDDHLFDHPYENAEFVEKFVKTFTESIEGFENKNYANNVQNQKHHVLLLRHVIVQEQKFGETVYIINIKKHAIKMTLLGGPFFKMFIKIITNYYMKRV